MRKQVRVLRAESREHHLVSVGAAVGVGIAVQADIGPILHQSAVAPRLHPEGHHQAVGEHPRGTR